MVLRNDRMPVYVSWALNGPIVFVLLLKTAGIADEIVHLAVLVFSRRYAVNVPAVHPGNRFAAAFVAVAVSVHGTEKPNPAFESECAVGQRTHRAHVYDIAAELAVDGFLDKGADLRVITAVEYAVYTLRAELLRRKHASEAHDAARHVQFDVWPDVYLLECAPFELIASAGFSVLESEVLQVALARLVADGAVEWVVDEQEFRDSGAGLHDRCVAFAGDLHAIHDHCLAGSHEFGHGARVFFRAFGDAHETGAALAARAFERGVVAHGWRHEIAADLPGRIEDSSAFCDFDGLSVYGDFWHIILQCSSLSKMSVMVFFPLFLFWFYHVAVAFNALDIGVKNTCISRLSSKVEQPNLEGTPRLNIT